MHDQVLAWTTLCSECSSHHQMGIWGMTGLCSNRAQTWTHWILLCASYCKSLSSAGCISVGESLSFQNNYFVEEAKIIIKLLQTPKKNDLVKCNIFPSNKSGLVQCNVFCDTKKFLFFNAGFVWMIKLVKKKNVLSCRQDSRFRRLPFFLPKLHSVLKKKGLKAKVVSVFCVIEPFYSL